MNVEIVGSTVAATASNKLNTRTPSAALVTETSLPATRRASNVALSTVFPLVWYLAPS